MPDRPSLKVHCAPTHALLTVSPPEFALPQTRHFRLPHRADLSRRLLRVMHAETAQKPRQAPHARPDSLEPQQQIPVEGELKTLIEPATNLLPN